MLEQLVGFTLAVTVLAVTPGVSMALVTERVLRHGRRASTPVALGTITGLYVHGLSAAAGLALLVAQSAAVFTAFKWLGAAYLVYLGLRTIATAGAHTIPAGRAAGTSGAWWARTYRDAALGNVLNPKAAGFYLTGMAQFVQPGDPILATTLLLVTIHALVALIWLTVWGWAVDRGRRGLAAPRVRAWLERASGAVLVALGVRLAAAARPR